MHNSTMEMYTGMQIYANQLYFFHVNNNLNLNKYLIKFVNIKIGRNKNILYIFIINYIYIFFCKLY